ncbi:hypothetical protein Tco_0791360 [Tanacetum coccineum]
MESSAVARYIPRKSLKRVFLGSSSSAMEPEVIEISDYPVESGDRTPKSVSRSKDKGKQKEVPFREIIDVDMDEDRNDVVFIDFWGEVGCTSNKKMKGAMGLSLGSGSSAQFDSKVTWDVEKKNVPRPKSSRKVRNSSSKTELCNDDVSKKFEGFKKFDTVMDHSDHLYTRQNSAMKQASYCHVKYHSGVSNQILFFKLCVKFCLSLLNYGLGEKRDVDSRLFDTMLQVIVLHTEEYLILSLKTMVYTMRKQPKHFEDLVVGHFRHRVRDILMACKAYTEVVTYNSYNPNPPGTYYPNPPGTYYPGTYYPPLPMYNPEPSVSYDIKPYDSKPPGSYDSKPGGSYF